MIRCVDKVVLSLCCALALVPLRTFAADPLPVETRLVASLGSPLSTTTSFSVASPQDLTITLTDLNFPAALQSASFVLTQGGVVAGLATFASPATTATFSLPAATGAYSLYVFGEPGASVSVGTYSLCVAPKASPSNCIQADSYSGNITAQTSAADPTLSTFSTELPVTTPGSYQFTVTDLQFPAALHAAPNVAVLQGTTVMPVTSGSALQLNPGTYNLLSFAQADPSFKAGLYGITITGPAGSSTLLDRTLPVGLMRTGAFFTNTSAQNVTLRVTDFAFPGRLATAGALVTAGGSRLVQSSASGGATAAMAPKGPLQLWTYGTAGATAGTFGADVAGATDLYTSAASVGPSGSNYAYAFVTPALTAGTYQASAADLQFPAPLTGLAFAVAQNGAILKQSAAAGTVSFTATAGPVVLLVSALTPAGNGNALLDLNIQSAGSTPLLLFDKTQTVSSTPALFDSQTLSIGTSAMFNVTVNDLAVPAPFLNLALVVSRGSTVLGKIVESGTFNFAGNPGDYQLTFIATPAAQQPYGLYAVAVAFGPPQVTLTANPTSAIVGGLIELSWTTSDSTGCIPSGGSFMGSIALGSGMESVILNGATTYTLTCTGPGGSTSQSVSVTTTTAPPPAGKSGGGEFDWEVSALIGLCSAVGAWSRRRRAEADGRSVQ